MWAPATYLIRLQEGLEPGTGKDGGAAGRIPGDLCMHFLLIALCRLDHQQVQHLK